MEKRKFNAHSIAVAAINVTIRSTIYFTVFIQCFIVLSRFVSIWESKHVPFNTYAYELLLLLYYAMRARMAMWMWPRFSTLLSHSSAPPKLTIYSKVVCIQTEVFICIWRKSETGWTVLDSTVDLIAILQHGQNSHLTISPFSIFTPNASCIKCECRYGCLA